MIISSPDSAFGLSLASLGDINKDGFDDFAVGAFGSFSVYLGSSGLPVLGDRQFPLLAGDPSRTMVAGAGDLDGDGWLDLVVGLPDGARSRGGIKFYRGRSTLPLVETASLTGSYPFAGMGFSLASIGDYDNDGVGDLIVGSETILGISPRAFLILGQIHLSTNISVAAEYYDPGWDGSFGRAVAGIGDVNNDGYDDFMVGEPGNGSTGFNGVVRIFHGGAIPGSVPASSITRQRGASRIGAALAGPLDFDGDGRPDFLYGAPAGRGLVFLKMTTSVPNYAVYCGVDAGEPGYSFSPGYGNNWFSALDFYWDVEDSTASTQVSINGVFNCSLENGYDWFAVQLITSDQAHEFASFSDLVATGSFAGTTLVPPYSLVRDPHTGLPAVLLRLVVDTDALYSDEDGLAPSGTGAAQVDNISVMIDSVLVSYATFQPAEPGANPDSRPGAMPNYDSGGWLVAPVSYFGDFAKLVIDFQDTDPQSDNFSPQVAFIDDGTPPANDPIMQSTGGTYADNNFSYGLPADIPGKFWGLNNTGGIGRRDNFYQEVLHNEVQSPPFLWNDPATNQDDSFFKAVLRCDVWSDIPYSEVGYFYYWMVRYTTPGSTWGPWHNDNFVYYGDTPAYTTKDFPIQSFVAADAESVQVALGVRYINIGIWGGNPQALSTVSPVFDNVKVIKVLNYVVSDTTWAGANVVTQVGDITVTFASVADSGLTTVDAAFGISSTPPGFMLASYPPLVYELQTTAQISGDIQICINYDENQISVPEQDLVLLHYDNQIFPPAWVDISVSVDTVANVVCGVATHLSPFTLAVPNAASGIGFNPVGRSVLRDPVPNPLNPSTRIEYSLSRRGSVDLSIFDLRGRLVKRLVSDFQPAGNHVRHWDGTGTNGRSVSSGVYFVRLTLDGRLVTTPRKVAVIR